MKFKDFKAAAAGQGNFEIDMDYLDAADWEAMLDSEVEVLYYWYYGDLTWYQYNTVRESFETKDYDKILLIKNFVPHAFPDHACVSIDGEIIGWLYVRNKRSLWELITDNEAEFG